MYNDPFIAQKLFFRGFSAHIYHTHWWTASVLSPINSVLKVFIRQNAMCTSLFPPFCMPSTLRCMQSYIKGSPFPHTSSCGRLYVRTLTQSMQRLFVRVLLVGVHAYAPFGDISTVANSSHCSWLVHKPLWPHKHFEQSPNKTPWNTHST